MKRTIPTLLIFATLLAAAAHAGTAPQPAGSDTSGHVQIRRTGDGTPHIKADGWIGLGYGYGYAQAEDNLCTMADAFVTYRGERSRYFGPDAHLPLHSTMGQPRNLDADFFFKMMAGDPLVARYRDGQSMEMRALVEGYARGYNAYLHALRSHKDTDAHASCRLQPWVTAISAADVYRRLYAANLAGGAIRFISGIAAAVPPALSPVSGRAPSTPPPEDLAGQISARSMQLGAHPGIGSNAMAFGESATRTRSGLLLGNPHWYWAGPDRLYQAQLTIPGRIDVAGASFLGVPVIMLGFNQAVAWTHTVSSARRFGIFELTLQKGNPTHYLYDGKPLAMTPVPLTVEVLHPDGSFGKVDRTLYRTRFGPVVNLSTLAPGMAWTGRKAFALRDINAENFRIFQNYLEWGQAGSLGEFVAIQKRLAAMPWVNTLAIDDKDGRAWYADIGAVPNVPDDLAAACTTELGKAFDRGAPGVPFLDGSRADCDWRTVAGAAQPGAMPADAMPSLMRRDVVANMNNTYALANPSEVLSGFPAIFGDTGKPLSLRQRLGQLMIRDRLSGADGYGPPGADSETVRLMALDSRSMSAILLKNPLLDQVCRQSHIAVHEDSATGARFDPAMEVPTGKACTVLRKWDDNASAQARGAFLWDEIWKRLDKLPPASLYAKPFDPTLRLDTPAGLAAANPAIAQGFGAAILGIEASGKSIDAPRGEVLYVDKGGTRIPLFGGCDDAGYFAVTCALWGAGADGHIEDKDLLGNSYMQIVAFGRGLVQAYTTLSHSESDDPSSPRYRDGTLRYADRQWNSWRYTEHDIRSDPELIVQTLSVDAAE
jgi:acyl-homoserine-lactone acylase